MAYTDEHRSPQERVTRERQLAAMREKWRRDPPRSRGHVIERQQVITVRDHIKPRSFAPRELAYAIRIAAKDAKERPNHNPAFVEALELAATFFDDL